MSASAEKAARGTAAGEPPALRRDARRNRELLIAAAHEIYAEQGVEAPLDEIARRAGVGNATLYRRFPTREALIEAVFHDTLAATREAGEQARRGEDAWEALSGYWERIFSLVAADRGANDLITTGIEGVPSLDALREHNHETVLTLVARAQDQGTMRPDVTAEDILFQLAALGRSVPAFAAVAPGSWRRHLALLLDALRPEGAHPLPAPPLSLGQLSGVMADMHPGRTPTS